MAFIPYLHFDGTCATAMTAYSRIFGATDLSLSRYSETPGVTGELATSDRVMHGAFSVDGQSLMASDFPPGVPADTQQAVSVCRIVTDPDTARDQFTALMEGGAIIAPFGPTFFSPGFGMGRDRFGTHWIFMVPAPATD